MINELTYEQTIELEKNVKIKNEAQELYRDFVSNWKLNVRSFNDGQFEDWNDTHNRCFITIKENVFTYHCRFLHESYDVIVTPSHLFSYIKNEYRGLAHFKSAVQMHKSGRR